MATGLEVQKGFIYIYIYIYVCVCVCVQRGVYKNTSYRRLKCITCVPKLTWSFGSLNVKVPCPGDPARNDYFPASIRAVIIHRLGLIIQSHLVAFYVDSVLVATFRSSCYTHIHTHTHTHLYIYIYCSLIFMFGHGCVKKTFAFSPSFRQLFNKSSLCSY